MVDDNASGLHGEIVHINLSFQALLKISDIITGFRGFNNLDKKMSTCSLTINRTQENVTAPHHNSWWLGMNKII